MNDENFNLETALGKLAVEARDDLGDNITDNSMREVKRCQTWCHDALPCALSTITFAMEFRDDRFVDMEAVLGQIGSTHLFEGVPTMSRENRKKQLSMQRKKTRSEIPHLRSLAPFRYRPDGDEEPQYELASGESDFEYKTGNGS
jgi:hypothetical protein